MRAGRRQELELPRQLARRGGSIGTMTGSPCANERTLDFGVLTGVRPMIETMPLERAADAYAKMKSGDVKFRMVLIMGDQAHADQ